MTVLVLGGGGMLGHVVASHLAARGLAVRATLRGRAPAGGARGAPGPGGGVIEGCDVLQPGAVERAMIEAEPDVVINCIGLTKQKETADTNVRAIELNALLPHRLAAICGDGRRLIQISTDCVFSGRRGMYREDDLPDPPDLYGRSKLAGEVGAPHLTLRTSLIGWQIAGSESLIAWFWSQRGRRIAGYTRAIFSGLTTYAMARVLERVITEHPSLAGTYHIAAAPISKFDLLDRLNRLTGSPVEIEPVAGPAIDRSLDGSRFAAATGIAVPGWDEMLRELSEKRGIYDV